jgi:hypothetical protein
MADATFIDAGMVASELDSLTTSRLPISVDAQTMARACRRVVSLIKGSAYEVPTAAAAPGEWKYLALEWLSAKLYAQYPEYFRAKMPTIEEVEARIARTARIEPTENKTHARSSGQGDDWDYPVCGGGIFP